MDKSAIYEEHKPRPTEGRLTTSILATAVLVLSLTFVVLTLCGMLYLSKHASDETKETKITLVTPSNHETNVVEYVEEEMGEREEPRVPPLEFYVGVPRWHFNVKTMVHQFISVDQGAGTEFIAFKDPDMMHIQNIIHVDHQRGVVVLYGSETAECLFIRDRSHAMAANLHFLRNNDGRNVSIPASTNDYKTGTRLMSFNDIPDQMSGLCTSSNSYWLVDAKSEDWSMDEKYHVCQCSYFKCFCTYCEDVLCWGRCASCQDPPDGPPGAPGDRGMIA